MSNCYCMGPEQGQTECPCKLRDTKLREIQFKPKSNCSQCGIVLDQIMGYVCPSANCPTFIQVTC